MWPYLLRYFHIIKFRIEFVFAIHFNEYVVIVTCAHGTEWR